MTDEPIHLWAGLDYANLFVLYGGDLRALSADVRRLGVASFEAGCRCSLCRYFWNAEATEPALERTAIGLGARLAP